MGKMKDAFIDQINGLSEEELAIYRQLEEESARDRSYEVREDGKKLFVIKDYKIWAKSYEDALELLPLIENF